jgi:hypothetical protein
MKLYLIEIAEKFYFSAISASGSLPAVLYLFYPVQVSIRVFYTQLGHWCRRRCIIDFF